MLQAKAIDDKQPSRDDAPQAIRQAWPPFIALIATYALEVFNDQFVKQTTLLIAVTTLSPTWQGTLQIIFYAPFVLLAAYTGWLADRFAKRAVVIGSKLLEIAAVSVGAYGLLCRQWTALPIAVGLLALRMTLFTPSINGSIPELFPDNYVTRANGILRIFTTVSMLAGIFLAGTLLNIPEKSKLVPAAGQATVAHCALLVALLGLLVSMLLRRVPAADPRKPFPASGPAAMLKTLAQIGRQDRLLTVTFCSYGYFWFLAALLQPLINQLGIKQYGYSSSHTSMLILAEVVGVAIGGLLGGWLAAGPRWHRVLAPAAVGMGCFLAALAGGPLVSAALRMPAMLAALALAGIAGGVFMIPLEGFVQVRPSAENKGTYIAAANLIAFSGMLLSGLAAVLLNKYVLPSLSFAVVGLLTMLVGVLLLRALRSER